MRFSIGEFSKITSLSIKSLRLYHEKELLIPAQVDEFSGYRYYDDSNYETARVIKILKNFDFTLGDSYKKLFTYIHEKGYQSKIPTREIYLKGPGMILKGNPKNYLTEILVMIE